MLPRRKRWLESFERRFDRDDVNNGIMGSVETRIED